MDLVRAVGILLLFASSTGALVVPTIAGAEDRPATGKENQAKAQALVKKGDGLIEATRPAEALATYTQAIDADGSREKIVEMDTSTCSAMALRVEPAKRNARSS